MSQELDYLTTTTFPKSKNIFQNYKSYLNHYVPRTIIAISQINPLKSCEMSQEL